MTGRFDRSGGSLLEVLLVLALSLWVVHGAWTSLVVHRGAGWGLAERAQDLETVRTLSWLVPEEVVHGRPGTDWWVGDEDSLALRSFRGLALVRRRTEASGSFVVCFRGLRSPDPEKDSVLVLEQDGPWRAHDLTSRLSRSDECLDAGGGGEEVWTLSPIPSRPVLMKLFERGTYHLAQKALRYSRGRGGRQPLTPERIEGGRFHGLGEAGGPFAWTLRLEGDVGGGSQDGAEPRTRWRGTRW